ncbi:MAG TPA: hypothetical protein VH518_19830 [Tepidisphaeraceae bacterium]
MHRPARSIWAMIFFLAGFTALIILVSHYFLIPALLASNGATAEEKRHLQAFATLLLTIVLFMLGVGIVLVLRVKRFFVSGPASTRQKTQYVDAWAEAGKRARADEEPAEE